jgi:hypothetical protein
MLVPDSTAAGSHSKQANQRLKSVACHAISDGPPEVSRLIMRSAAGELGRLGSIRKAVQPSRAGRRKRSPTFPAANKPSVLFYIVTHGHPSPTSTSTVDSRRSCRSNEIPAVAATVHVTTSNGAYRTDQSARKLSKQSMRHGSSKRSLPPAVLPARGRTHAAAKSSSALSIAPGWRRDAT